jgi:hypothetical protein
MAVLVSSTGTAVYNFLATTQNFTFTVNVGDTLAVFYVGQDDNVSNILSATWDTGGTNQACTLIGSKTVPSGGLEVFAFGVVNPTPGTHVFTVTIHVATDIGCCFQSYTGTSTASVGDACVNFLAANGNTTGIIGTAAQSGAAGDLYVSTYLTPIPAGLSAISDTVIFNLQPVADNNTAANLFPSSGLPYALTATTVAGSPAWAAISFNIAQAVPVIPPIIPPVIPALNRLLSASVSILEKDPNYRGILGVIENVAEPSIVTSISEPTTVPASGAPVPGVAGARVAIIS